MYLLAGSTDEVVTPEQLFAVERLVGTRPPYLRQEVAPCNHLGLFMGRLTLEEYWPRIVRWMKEPLGFPDEHAALKRAAVRRARSANAAR
jgi:hypothetical protein